VSRLACAVLLAAVLVLPAAEAQAQDALRAETKDWIFTAPAAIVSASDLDLVARGTQLCHDEIVLLTGHRPASTAKFTWTWAIDGSRGAHAYPGGVVGHVPSAAYRIVEDVARPFWQDRIARGTCFGPHEVTHVLTFPSGMPAWAFEGLATFTDFLYSSAQWRCCGRPPLSFSCDDGGYTDGLERHSYSDLSPFSIDYDSYRTASCAWLLAYRAGGFPAVRGILAGLRARPARSTAELVAHFARVLHRDVRPVFALYGFSAAEVGAEPAPAVSSCTLIGTARAETITGTRGPDTICGLAGADLLLARDGRRDVVRGGPGRDSARVDRGLDRVVGVERILR
jgi:hypothetical protein